MYSDHESSIRFVAVTVSVLGFVSLFFAVNSLLVPVTLLMVSGVGTIWLLNARGIQKPKGKPQLTDDGEFSFDIGVTGPTRPHPSLPWQALCGAIVSVWLLDLVSRLAWGMVLLQAEFGALCGVVYIFAGALIGGVAGLALGSGDKPLRWRRGRYLALTFLVGLPVGFLLFYQIAPFQIVDTDRIILDSRAYIVGKQFLPALGPFLYVALLILAVRQLAVPEWRSKIWKSIALRGLALLALTIPLVLTYATPWDSVLRILPGMADAFDRHDVIFEAWLPYNRDWIMARWNGMSGDGYADVKLIATTEQRSLEGYRYCQRERLGLPNRAVAQLCFLDSSYASRLYAAAAIIVTEADGARRILAYYAAGWSRMALSPDGQWIAFAAVTASYEREGLAGIHAVEILTGRVVQFTDAPLVDPQWKSYDWLTGLYVSMNDPNAGARYAFTGLLPINAPTMQPTFSPSQFAPMPTPTVAP